MYNTCIAVALIFCVKLHIPRSVFYRISNVLQFNEVVGRPRVLKFSPTYEADERYSCCVFEKRATVVRNLRSRFGKSGS